MQKGFAFYWRQLGHVEKAFLVCVLLSITLYAMGAGPLKQTLVGFIAFALGLTALVRLARRAMKNAIWRLRNRLIAAYLFIAVVPVLLILTLVAMTAYVVMGQMAVYLITTELTNRQNNLSGQASALARVPAAADPERALNRFVETIRTNAFPNFELLAKGARVLRYPPDSQLTPPPPVWQRTHGLIARKEGEETR